MSSAIHTTTHNPKFEMHTGICLLYWSRDIPSVLNPRYKKIPYLKKLGKCKPPPPKTCILLGTYSLFFCHKNHLFNKFLLKYIDACQDNMINPLIMSENFLPIREHQNFSCVLWHNTFTLTLSMHLLPSEFTQ